MDEMDLSQFKEVFISEAKEHLVSLNTALLELEKNPDNKEMINQIFRAAHTLKGMSATMGFEKITQLAHKMEDVLDKLRKGDMKVKQNTVDLIFKCFDVLEKLVEEAGNDITDSKIDVSGLVENLGMLLSNKEPADAQQQTPTPIPAAKPAEPQVQVQPAPTPAPVKTEPVQKPAPVPEEKKTPEKPANTEAVQKHSPEQAEESEALSQTKKAQSSIRINISYLDTMMNLVGEMVISKSQMEQIGHKHNIEELNEALQQFDRIAIELQEAVLKTRMVTLSHIFDRYPRMIRDLSIKLSKEIDFEIFGADIEIDRMLLDEINEPLLHLLRNSIDHGIESHEERLKAGKQPKGKITLSAFRDRGYISIKVTDDGKGLDTDLLKRKSIEKGIITEDIAATLSDEDTYMLICDPRFSTAEKISDISGRGVGMDVVKTAMESVNGHLVISSKKGEGSSFIVNLPLTMAIISALLVKVGNEMYAIPLNNITEIVALTDEIIKSVSGKEVIVLRNEVLPLIRLKDKLSNNNPAEKKSSGFILRVESGLKAAYILVDNFIGRKEIVIKTLSGITKKAKGFSGATILGDGSVVLIVDIGSWI